ncbi:hypothetical protein K435DRAFT_859042 [Dendrothele bispora CBS 962.96]|uniref:Uncharacterized protein n=1 Tax=Dendrothele bispora (strain CBS 962.96) TaxID=1314807 RepID=A0A4S8M2P8_DENBC|nr:hypothetical protein K435DRAFT_859042 [Dendrothele bispora CBS 962.96]
MSSGDHGHFSLPSYKLRSDTTFIFSSRMPRQVPLTVSSRSTRSAARSAGPAQLATMIISQDNILPASASVHAPGNHSSQRLNEPEREWQLYHDKCAAAVGPIDVLCVGCERFFKLDRRQLFYSGPWLRHKRICPELRAKPSLTQDERVHMPNIPNDIHLTLKSGNAADMQAILGPLRMQKPYLHPDHGPDEKPTVFPSGPLTPTSASISTQASPHVETRPTLRIIIPPRPIVPTSAPASQSTLFLPPFVPSSSSSSSSPYASSLFSSTSSSSLSTSPPSSSSFLSASSFLAVHPDLWARTHSPQFYSWEGSLAERVHFYNGFAAAMKSREMGLEFVGECSAIPESFERSAGVM